LNYPRGLVTDLAGNLYIGRLQQLSHPHGCAQWRHQVRSSEPASVAPQATEAPPPALAFYHLGARIGTAAGSLYIAEYGANRIRKVAGGIINTIAGSGTSGYAGDGGSAIAASLKSPMGVAVGRCRQFLHCRLFQSSNSQVAGGNISTVAGTGTAGYSGDGGPATSAQLNYPRGIALDSSGNLYIADYSNNRVRMIATNGAIMNCRRNGIAGHGGDAGSAANAQLTSPLGVTLDYGGNLYVADSTRVRKVIPSGVHLDGYRQRAPVAVFGRWRSGERCSAG